jgi:hypothetical protein
VTIPAQSSDPSPGHLSTIDRAQLALLIKPKFEAAAAERKAATLPPKGVRADVHNSVSAPVHGRENQDLTGKSSDQAAKVVGVSGRTVENVALIQKQAPALIPDIKAGLLTIPQAVDKVRAQDELKRKQELAAKQALPASVDGRRIALLQVAPLPLDLGLYLVPRVLHVLGVDNEAGLKARGFAASFRRDVYVATARVKLQPRLKGRRERVGVLP